MDNLEIITNNLLSFNIKESFGIPGGGESLKLIDNFEKNKINFHLTKFEGSASIMGATFGHLSESPGVSISIKGPGFVNSLPGLAFSYFESYPLLHLTEAFPLNAANSIAHKRLDHYDMTKSFVKDFKYFDSLENSYLDLLNCAIDEEPGPVILQLAEGYNNNKKSKKGITKDSIYSEIDINLFQRIKKPIFIVGSLACRKKLHNFFSKFNFPIFTTVSAKGFYDENKSNSAGIYTGVGLSMTPEFQLLNQSDCIFCIGLTAKEVLSVNPFKSYSINFELNNTPGVEGFRFNKRIHLSNFINIVEKLNNYSWGTTELKQIKNDLYDRLTKNFLPGQVYDFINKKYQNDCRIVIDTGNFCTIGEHMLKCSNNKNILLSAQSRFMGTSIPMGIAASIYNPSFKTIIFVGDGGIGMFLAEVDLAVKYNLPIILIFMTDHSFASIRSRSIQKNLTQSPLKIGARPWVNIFESFGFSTFKVKNLSELDNSLKIIDNISKPAFIEIEFNQDQYLVMTDDIR